MASIRRLAGTIQACRTVGSRKTLAPPAHRLPHQPSHRSFNHHVHAQHSEGRGSRSWPKFPAPCSVPAILAGLSGVALVDVAYADARENDGKTSLPLESQSSPDSHLPPESKSPPESHSTYVDLEATAKKDRTRLEELLKSKGMQSGSYPRFTVAVKGQKVTIKFQLPPTWEIAHLISILVSRLGAKVEERGTGSDMTLRAWNSGVAWQLTLSRPRTQKEQGEDQGNPTTTSEHGGDLCILMFRSLISTDKPEIEFIKQGSFSSEELEVLASVLQSVGKNMEPRPRADGGSLNKSVTSLDAMGVKIYGLNESNLEQSRAEISWDSIAGYVQQKREIEDTILMSLRSPEVYDEIARGTRCKFETNRPHAVLFEGPPGTGKTSCARVIANQAGVPLLYVPLEVIMSKYFGESERLLGKVFSLANEIPNGAIIFLDEVDAFATARDSETHEATRRILSVILRQIDGFEQDKRVVVIAATNRKQDLDPALMSRFDSMITFGLPDHQTRQEIAAQYARHLTKSEIAGLATVTEEMSGRDIRDVCQQAERRWASKIIRGQAQKDGDRVSLPPLQEYIDSAIDRQKAQLAAAWQNNSQNHYVTKRKPQFDFI